MGLHEWQRALGAMITSRDVELELADPGLGADERRWLLATTRDPGLAITRHAQRSWRRMRLANALPMTMAILPSERREAMIESYLDGVPCISFFHTHEARGFARFLASHAEADGHARALARFEVAVADALEHRVFDDDPPAPPQRADSCVRMHPAATLVEFAATPERVLAAAIAGHELPAIERVGHVLLVAPGLPSLARSVAGDELACLRACAKGTTLTEIAGHLPAPSEWLALQLEQRVLTA